MISAIEAAKNDHHLTFCAASSHCFSSSICSCLASPLFSLFQVATIGSSLSAPEM